MSIGDADGVRAAETGRVRGRRRECTGEVLPYSSASADSSRDRLTRYGEGNEERVREGRGERGGISDGPEMSAAWSWQALAPRTWTRRAPVYGTVSRCCCTACMQGRECECRGGEEAEQGCKTATKDEATDVNSRQSGARSCGGRVLQEKLVRHDAARDELPGVSRKANRSKALHRAEVVAGDDAFRAPGRADSRAICTCVFAVNGAHRAATERGGRKSDRSRVWRVVGRQSGRSVETAARARSAWNTHLLSYRLAVHHPACARD